MHVGVYIEKIFKSDDIVKSIQENGNGLLCGTVLVVPKLCDKAPQGTTVNFGYVTGFFYF